ncbi:sulfatase [Micromonospora sp. NPDC049559]|uniref:sulfatase n=1 Tax=Micromonospora sp. NPDC049559 TaxID=3155923 RepID=UPI003443B0BD
MSSSTGPRPATEDAAPIEDPAPAEAPAGSAVEAASVEAASVEATAGSAAAPAAPGEAAADAPGPGRSRRRRVLAAVTTGGAFLLVLLVLVAPERLGRLTPAAFVRIPVEGLVAAALVLLLPPRGRRVAAVLIGVALGLLTVVKLLDLGFFEALDRPFNLVLDWVLLDDAYRVLTDSVGRAGAAVAAVVLVLAVCALLALMALSVLRLTRVAVRHRRATARGLGVLAAAWVVCALLGAQLVPGEPVAASSAAGLAYDRTRQVREGVRDQKAFAAQAAVDAFADVPGDRLLTALRGKDVVVSFVESYGRVAVEDPQIAPGVNAVLDEGTRRLAAAGFGARSGFLTSSTAGGGSWLAHATLLSGLWIDNQQRDNNLMASDRLTLNGAFRRAGWRTVTVMPALVGPWPEGAFYQNDQIYGVNDLGYRGPKFSFAPMPDQYTLSAFQRLERAKPDRRPLMAEIPLVSSHSPWAPIPRMVGWDELGDGTVFGPIARQGASPDDVWRDPARIRTEYGRSIEYSLESLISYVERYGDDRLVLVFLGDHQPAPVVTGEGAGRDVPITIVARDPKVLERVAGWGWQDGLRPGPQAPVWRMDTFRDRFLTAFQ